MTGDIFDDISKFRIDPATAAKAKPAKPKSKWQRRYVRVPWPWIDQLKSSASANTYRLAMHLLYASWRNGGRAIRLGNAALEEAGVTRKAKRLALNELEQYGLIKVRRQPRKSPLVTVIGDRMEGDA